MAAYDLEEQEQISALKAWWDQYGTLVTAVAVVAALSSFAWQGWRWYQNKQGVEASAIYFVVQQAADAEDAQKARESAGRLIEQYGGSVYAQMGALLSAGVQFRKGELDNAKAQLEWAVGKGADPALRDLARLRLAVVQQQQGQTDQALAGLQAAPLPAYKARFDDLRGDLLAAQGKTAEARAAYQAVIDMPGDTDQQAATLREIVRMKLESLEG